MTTGARGMGTPPPRVAPVLLSLLREVDALWPSRAKTFDGTFGDDRHKARKSDHNPDSEGYCRALDLTRDDHDGPPLHLLADYIRHVGATGSQRLAVGGYVIFDRRIASDGGGWIWRPYTGDNPHVSHLHVSCSALPVFYMIGRPWGLTRAKLRKYRQPGG